MRNRSKAGMLGAPLLSTDPPGDLVLLAYLESVNWRLVATWAAGLAGAGVLLLLGLPLLLAALGVVAVAAMSCQRPVRDHLAVRRSLDGQLVVRRSRRLRPPHPDAVARAAHIAGNRRRRLARPRLPRPRLRH